MSDTPVGRRGVLDAPPALAAALRTINIAQIRATSGRVGSVALDQVAFGRATINRLVVSNASASLRSGSAFLETVRVIIELRFTLDWEVDVFFFERDGTVNLGSVSFPITVGNVEVPSLEDINVDIPSAVATDVSAQIAAISALELGGGRFSDLRVDTTRLPTPGFEVSGLDLGALTLTTLGFPHATIDQVSLATFEPSVSITVPAIEATNIQLPSVSVPNVVSQGGVTIDDITASRRGPPALDLGFLRVQVFVQPILDLQIGTLLLSDIEASAAIGRLRLEGLSAPLSIRGLRLGDLELDEVTVNQVSL